MTDTAVAKIEGEAPALPAATSYLEVISRVAADPACDVDKLERLLAMQERVMAINSEQAFNRAMAEAQAEMPQVLRNAKNQQTNSKYATLEGVANAINPIITKHGFSMSFGSDVSPLENHYRVTCKVAHRDGHCRDYHADVPTDIVGLKGNANKTATHGFGSTMSYGRRYLTLLIFNITMTDEDDDGNRAASGPVISEGQRGELLSIIEEKTVTTQKFCERYKIASVADLPEAKFEAAKKALLSTPDKPKGAAQ